MQKFFHLSAASSAVLITLTAEIALSLPQSRASQYPTVSRSNINEPVCYMRTETGKTLDLSRICGKKASVSDDSNSQQTNQVDNPPTETSDLPENVSPQ